MSLWRGFLPLLYATLGLPVPADPGAVEYARRAAEVTAQIQDTYWDDRVTP